MRSWWWVCMRSEVNYGVCVTFICILTSNIISRLLTSCIFIVTSEGYTCPVINLWPQTHSLGPYRMTSHLKLISSCFDFHWLGTTAILLSSQKQPLSHFWMSKNQWFCTWRKASCWFIYKMSMMTKYPILFNFDFISTPPIPSCSYCAVTG